MKVTLNWLRQYVELDGSPDALAERLTLLGLEVEGIRHIAGEFDGIVVAQVLTREKHPNADKLSLCRVNDGLGERQIVCGAHNFQPGDKVPLILPGASLPLKPGEQQPFTIKVGKIRGVESHGMLCSPQELGLPDDVDGLLILRPDARVGQPFAEYLGRRSGDVVFDLEVTPNRPDLNSVIGIAREIAAVTGNSLRLPDPALPASDSGVETMDRYVAVRLDDPKLCPRYTARILLGVRVGPSPDWLRQTLEAVGLRSINNVVDVTNYVMLETGQPLHAFDYHLIGRETSSSAPLPTIIVRRAASGEPFVTLDGIPRTLRDDMLLIADPEKPIALAGVMGGRNTEIQDSTTDVLIESAWFQPTNIRRTSKALGLRTESSYRFERGADISILDYASRRACQLILQTAGGRLVPGFLDACPEPITSRQITLRHQKVNELLGIQLGPEKIELHLAQLGILPAPRKPRPVDDFSPVEPAAFRIPSFRVDLKREVDLIEEVARLQGVDHIPSTAPRGATGSNSFDALHDQIAEARRLLAGLGLNEAQGQTLVSDVAAVRVAPLESLVALANPLSSDMNTLRPSLLPGLLDTLRHNLRRKNESVAVFEIGRVFFRSSGRLQEERRLALALTGLRNAPFWTGEDRKATLDLYDLKGLLEEFLDHFGIRPVAMARRDGTHGLFLESATIALGGKLPLGELGQLLPSIARDYDLRDAVLLAELRLDELLARRNPGRGFKPLPHLPAIRRDIALLVPEAITHDAVLQAVRQAKPANLESIELFDVFRGATLPAGHKSVAYAFTYRAADRTLTDGEVSGTHERLVEQLKQRLGAAVR